MNNTLDLFKERTDEIDFIFSVMQDIEENRISISDRSLLTRILKSNFLLMLYNLVEACVVSGMLEIYEELKNNKYVYEELIDEVQKYGQITVLMKCIRVHHQKLPMRIK